MSMIKWIKISTNIFDDEKIKLIDGMPERDTILVVLFKIFVLAGKSNNSGELLFSNKIPYTDEMLSTIFDRPLNSVRLALSVLVQYEIIELLNKDEQKIYYLKNWSKYQNIDGMERVKELNRQRVENYREKQKLLSLSSKHAESEIYELYKKGYTLRDIGKKFNMSKNTVSRIIKKIENLLKENNNMPDQYDNEIFQNNSNIDKQEDSEYDSDNKTGETQLSHICPTTVPYLSQDCPCVVPMLSHDGTKITPKTVPNFVPRDNANASESKDNCCNVTSNVSVTLRNAYKNKNKNKDIDLEKENTEEEDLRNDEKRRCVVIPENIISFNPENNKMEIPEALIKILQSAYPDVDLELKFKEMSLWLMSNPETVLDIQKNNAGNFMRFAVKWLFNEKTKTKANAKTKKATKYNISFDSKIASFTGLTEDYLNILKSKFPYLDIYLEIKKMESWLLNNPSKRPASDYMRFINNWLTRAQDNKSLKSSINYSKRTWDEIRTEKNNEISKRLEEKIKAGLL